MNRLLLAVLLVAIYVPGSAGAAPVQHKSLHHATGRGGKSASAPARAPVAPLVTLPATKGQLIRGLLPNGIRLVLWFDPDQDFEYATLSVGVGSQLDMEHKQGAAKMVAELLRCPAVVPPGVAPPLVKPFYLPPDTGMLVAPRDPTAPAPSVAVAPGDSDDLDPRASLPMEIRCDEDAASFLFCVKPGDFKDSLEAFGERLVGFAPTDSMVDEARARFARRYQDQLPWSEQDAALRKELYTSYGYHRRPDGDLETLPNVVRDIVRPYWSQYYRPNNAVLVVTGPIAPDDVQRMARKAFERWEYGYQPPSNPNSPPTLEHHSLVATPRTEGFCAATAGAVVPHASLADRAALEVWAEAVSVAPPDSLADSLGWSPWMHAQVRRHKLCDEMRIHWTGPESQVPELVKSWLTETSTLGDHLTPERLEVARAAAIDRLTDGLTWTCEASRAQLYGWTVDTPAEIEGNLNAVTRDRVREAIRRCAPLEHWALVVSASASTWEPAVGGVWP